MGFGLTISYHERIAIALTFYLQIGTAALAAPTSKFIFTVTDTVSGTPPVQRPSDSLALEDSAAQ